MPRAVVLKKIGEIAVQEVESPTAGDGQVVIKTKVAAINPIDWKMIKHGMFVQSFPARLGLDVSGVVEEVGPNAEKFGFKKGDEVFARPLGNGYSEFATANARDVYKKPSNLSFEQAATLPVAVLTTIVGLFSNIGLQLARPKENRRWFVPEFVIIWGGSSSVGSIAVQLAAAAGYAVLATASPKHHEYVRKLGAIHVVDYSRSDVVDELKKLTSGRCRTAFDCIGGNATRLSAEVLRADLERPATVVSIAVDPANAPTLPDGVALKAVTSFDPSVQDFVAEVMNEEVLEYFAQGRLSPNNVKIVEGGLDGVTKALDLSSTGKVSGEKLVVVLE
ncbi:hypothetical protein PhCBS80983_g05345 [Powellomyces hirtus]|uniref:Enoyl reductase (ER) domain-containing protein n=1 Tax=Powellomyces hirtus TaxID=109895 RepID=A0A507DW20_9FUNG|nr:hypothetical protein PhCBS80983_g05345 [Powellomyces hirtus]